MSLRPEVSVIIPAFNASELVTVAIQSALGQSITNLEVIVVDDGSTDDTALRVNELNDERIRVFRQDNQGQSAAINNGATHARGSHIKLLDADDWLNPTHLQAQLRAIDGHANSLACCRWGYFVSDYRQPVTRPEYTDRDYDLPLEWIVDSLVHDEGMMGGCRWLIPRPIWEKAGGFDTRLSLNNDFHFSIKLLLASEGVRFSGDAVYSYRKGLSGALSGSSGRRALESAFLTTELGTRLLLEREDSQRIRRICADRFQQWLFRFYPEYPNLVEKAQQRIAELGGSDLELTGGKLLRMLKPLLGWKAVRRLQTLAYRNGWTSVLQRKATKRLRVLE